MTRVLPLSLLPLLLVLGGWLSLCRMRVDDGSAILTLLLMLLLLRNNGDDELRKRVERRTIQHLMMSLLENIILCTCLDIGYILCISCWASLQLLVLPCQWLKQMPMKSQSPRIDQLPFHSRVLQLCCNCVMLVAKLHKQNLWVRDEKGERIPCRKWQSSQFAIFCTLPKMWEWVRYAIMMMWEYYLEFKQKTQRN